MASDEPTGAFKEKPLTWRSVAVGLFGVALLCAVTPYNDFKLHQTYLYGYHLPVGCLFLFLLLTLGFNTIIRPLRPASAFSRQELVTVWAMLITGSGLASSGLMRYLGPLPVAPFYYADASNRWGEWARYIPGWMVPSHDAKSPVVQWFFEGMPPGGHVPWSAWTTVFATWGVLLALVVGLSIFLCALARKQWVDRERLVFPLVHIPIEMSREPEKGLVNSFFRSKLMWLGVSVSVTVHGINGLHAHYFSIPEIPLYWEVWRMLPDPPWNALWIWRVNLYLSAVGIGYLLPSDVSLSIWAFFLLFRLLHVVRVSMGIEAVTSAVPNHESAVSIGGFLVWTAWMLWVARGHLGAIWRSLTRPSRGKEDANEPIPMRTAAMGAVVCFLGVVAWTTIAGVNVLFAFLLWAIFVVILLVLTRIVAESGLMMVQTPFVPTEAIGAIPGTHIFNASGVGAAVMVQTVFMHDPREAYMPSVMNAMRLKGEGSGRGIVTAIILATAAGFVVSFVSCIWLSYRYGGVNLDAWGDLWCPKTHYNRIINYLDYPTHTNWADVGNIVIGGAIAAFLLVMRKNYLWWNLQPIGLTMGCTYAVSCIWFSIFIAWLCKRLAMKGGFATYRMLLPFFLGMVLGDAVIAGVWVIVGMCTGVGVPWFLPG